MNLTIETTARNVGRAADVDLGGGHTASPTGLVRLKTERGDVYTVQNRLDVGWTWPLAGAITGFQVTTRTPVG